MSDETLFWIFHNVHEEETEAFLTVLPPLAAAHGAQLRWARAAGSGLVIRADFATEDAAREFWLDLHERAIEQNLAMELTACDAAEWRDWESGPGVATDSATAEGAAEILAAAGAPAGPATGIAHYRPEIPSETLYDLLRQGDPELEGKLDGAIASIEEAGLPVINLLSYLDLPLFREYAEAHDDEREQNLFLHMLHTWACYRRYGAVHAAISPALAETLADPRYLRINTTTFRSPAPALCLQLPPWGQQLRGAIGRMATPMQWVKEVYITHCEPPTPADDRELTLMIVTHDERGQFGFVPLELPLSLPAVDQSLEAFFAPSLEDEQFGANTQDLRRIALIAAAYCLYATARDPTRYLPSAPG